MTESNPNHPLKEKTKSLPQLPGIYLMKDGRGRILYVGKAKNLRRRVSNYFRKPGDLRPRLPYLLAKVNDVDYLVTDTEKEALILENNLIKKYRPRYNIYFRDDKTFYHLRLDRGQKYPRFTFIRKPRNDGALYFGPYASSRSMKSALSFIQKIFPIRLCSDNIFRHRSRPCIYYQMGRCPAPCVGFISPEEHRRRIDQVILFFRGRKKELVSSLRVQMKTAVEAMEYEEAARIHGRIRAIVETVEEQKVCCPQGKDQDIFSLSRRGEEVMIQILHIRQGKMTGGQSVYFKRSFPDNVETLSSFITQFYRGERFIPDEILLPFPLEEAEAVKSFLTEKKRRKVLLIAPRRGEKWRLVDLATKNARLALEQHSAMPHQEELLDKARLKLRLKNPPRTVECFDISNLAGREAVGSMVVFRDGLKSPDDYRRYRIRALRQADDYGMMFEVLLRRYERALEKGSQPDLVLVDGGKGQLNIARRVLEKLGMDYPDVVALAKEKAKKGKKIRDRVFLPGRKNALFLPPASPLLHWLMEIRDEAHRFAISYHRKLRRKERLTSIFDDIPGIGPVLKKRLLTHFKDIGAVKTASTGELTKVPGISSKLAKKIYQYFH